MTYFVGYTTWTQTNCNGVIYENTCGERINKKKRMQQFVDNQAKVFIGSKIQDLLYTFGLMFFFVNIFYRRSIH
jgi:hypothetical protein